MLGVILAEHHIHKVAFVGKDGDGIELVLPYDVVRLRKPRGRGRGDERGHKLRNLGFERHTADAVVAAGDYAEQLPETAAVVRHGDGVVPLAFDEFEHVGKGVVGHHVGVGHHETRLVVLDAAHHSRLVFHGLRAVNE